MATEANQEEVATPYDLEKEGLSSIQLRKSRARILVTVRQ